MTIGLAEVLPFAIGVAISPVPIIAVILMLFSSRAKVNGPMFLIGWAVALSIVSGLAFLAGDAASQSTATDAVSWSQVLVGALFVVLAVRTWSKRAPAGEQPEPPKWMAGIDSFSPVKALTLALLLAGVNPKNLLLAAGAGAAVAGLALPTTRCGGLAGGVRRSSPASPSPSRSSTTWSEATLPAPASTPSRTGSHNTTTPS